MNAILPKLFPFFHSITPATNCAPPPKKTPIPIIILLTGKKPALCMFNKTVVIAKPNNPKGPGFAVWSLIE